MKSSEPHAVLETKNARAIQCSSESSVELFCVLYSDVLASVLSFKGLYTALFCLLRMGKL